MNGSLWKPLERNGGEGFLAREGTLADAKAISMLLTAAFVEFEPLYTPEAFVATVLPETGVLARMQEGPVWVVEKAFTLVGTVAALCTQDSVMVRGMAVAPSSRGLGVARALLNLTVNFARRQGYKHLFLYTTAFLKQAIHLYQTVGFQFTGEKTNPHGTELLRMVMPLTDNESREATEI